MRLSLSLGAWWPEGRSSSSVLFYGIVVWRLARPLQDLNVLLLEPLLCCLGHVFWVIDMLEYPSTTHFQCPGWLQCPGPDRTWPPSNDPLMQCSFPVPLAEKHPQSIMFPPQCLMVGGVLRVKRSEMTEHLRRDDDNPSEDLRGSQPSAIILT